jgi:hypothetical protein
MRWREEAESSTHMNLVDLSYATRNKKPKRMETPDPEAPQESQATQRNLDDDK